MLKWNYHTQHVALLRSPIVFFRHKIKTDHHELISGSIDCSCIHTHNLNFLTKLSCFFQVRVETTADEQWSDITPTNHPKISIFWTHRLIMSEHFYKKYAEGWLEKKSNKVWFNYRKHRNSLLWEDLRKIRALLLPSYRMIEWWTKPVPCESVD